MVEFLVMRYGWMKCVGSFYKLELYDLINERNPICTIWVYEVDLSKFLWKHQHCDGLFVNLCKL